MGTLRLLLALSVVVCHARPAWSQYVLVGGHTAVRLFYVISGFYMALILREKYLGEGAASRFWKNRLLRLLPGYYAVLAAPLLGSLVAVCLAGRPALYGQLAIWGQCWAVLKPGTALALALLNLSVVGQELTWLGAIDPAAGSFVYTADYHGGNHYPGYWFMLTPPSWSLSLELEFYALAPWLMKRSSRFLAALGASSLAVRFALSFLGVSGHPLWSAHFLPSELVFFLSGVLSYRLYARARAALPEDRLAAWGRFGGLLAVSAWSAYPWTASCLRTTVCTLILAAALPGVFAVTRRSRFDTLLGHLSFPVYLTHWHVIILVSYLAAKSQFAFLADPRGALVIALVLTLAASAALYRWVDRPVDRLRQRLARPGPGQEAL